MPIKLSHNIENIPPSATMLMTQLARDLKAEGKNIISMSAGEPDFDTPKTIKEAAIAVSYTHLTLPTILLV